VTKDQEKLLPGLYMVSTPIGNLEDLTFRAVRVLMNAHWVAAEDTRESRKLLDSQGISTELISLHEHSGPKKIAELVARLKAGETGAYVSDAGAPGLCDPGAELVAAAAAAGVGVYPIPGASAPVALLSVCGFAASDFSFHGFFPREKREEFLRKIGGRGGLQLFFESPHRIKECLKALDKRYSEKQIVVGRELTKKFETLYRGTVAVVAERINAEEPRGEYVLALDLGEAPEERLGLSEAETRALLSELAALGSSQKTLTRVAMSHGVAKNAAYALALEILGK
jgi:16S rRNA (cytidine1402-2'-O)-methyltransferase